ncbi:type I-G CRISPR-associated protein Csb2 [Rhodospira trueperi]|uniref:CRISPR-associated protein Csb2 n=1 Tax=Rhodospira trueperi TaxID=69960 RepID=A0A1G7EFV3_9PROT|nr:type I-U CRISPR-associated protein Csb2 [Rhodospira trueperi]SDE62512.1 CRISPR-associated protein Csb2 [Rhodospira trueperi]
MTRPEEAAPDSLALTIAVYLVEPRFHGTGDWPPSPFRLFQALMAGALLGQPRSHRATLAESFAWLETLEPPMIAAPTGVPGRQVTTYVPNNDLDAVGGDPAKVSEIRDAKRVRPQLLEDDRPILYAWTIPPEAETQAQRVAVLAKRLYRLGTGLDVAWASAWTEPFATLESRLAEHGGVLYRPLPLAEDGQPGPSMDARVLRVRCPAPRSFDSLAARHDAQAQRFQAGGFRQAPPAHYRVHPYNAPPTRLLFDIVNPGPQVRPAPQPLDGVVGLTETVRDALAARLLRGRICERHVLAYVIGRGATDADKARRIRLIPLPSIGVHHADRAVRRLLVEVPAECPISAETVHWALTGWDLGTDPDTGELPADPGATLVPVALTSSMLKHYGVGTPHEVAARTWRTVTPAALPLKRARGRVSGAERAATEARLAAAVQAALRHAGVPEATVTRVQREPFEARGERAEAFAATSRFSPDVLHHVEVAFDTPVTGPILIGDGRFLGLGLLAPVRDADPTDADLCVLKLGTPVPATDRAALLRAVRRALIARAEDDPEAATVKPLISGHAPDGAPLRSGGHDHIFLAAAGPKPDDVLTHVLIVPPWRFQPARRTRDGERRGFDRVARDLRTVRAGALGVLDLAPDEESALGAVFGPARVWHSATPYRPTRHPRGGAQAEAALIRDVQAECRRRGLPRPDVSVTDLSVGPRGGNVMAAVRLAFEVAVRGPILLGRDCHRDGGGLFQGDAMP